MLSTWRRVNFSHNGVGVIPPRSLRGFSLRGDAVPWSTSDRRSRLPAGWDSLRRTILRRDNHRCVWLDQNGQPCGEPATEVDHIRPGDDHSAENLRALCSWHHAKKSALEGNRAKARLRREIGARFRRQEIHPGLM
ncbi:hypothetical protein EDD28_0056 [Salana multivorans]|uniref:HNH nuclease domain-containing protein n=1 Tax=Salana multivorans TaxID=120377 RepID=A0A3N2D6W0_9MICO|nr:hypothetical protein EDD28_0056 [Salana multivorans]